MSVALPVASVVFGSVTPPQGDIVDLRVHLGCTNEVSSFECLLQNFDKKYSPSGTYPINVGVDGSISLGRSANCPLILTLKVEEIEPQSTATENYIRVRGRCWGEQLFRRLVTKSWDNVKGEVVVKYVIDNYTSLSHIRSSVELIEDTDTTYTHLEYEDTPVFDIIKYIAETADKAGAIGFDFRIAPDAKFEFFPKNTKTSSINLSERLEVSEYSKNIHRIRNKITVYGAAERSKPTNEDDWTDGLADQSQSDLAEDSHNEINYQLVSTLQFTPDVDKKIVLKKVQLNARVSNQAYPGYYKITYQKGAGTETLIVTDQSFSNEVYESPGFDPKIHTCAINGDYGEQITIRFYTRVGGSATYVYSKNYYMYYDILTYDWNPDQAGLGIVLDTTEKQQGTASVKVSATTVTWAGATLTLGDTDKINGNKFANINVKVKLESTYKGSGQIYLYSTQTPPDNYVSQPINVAVGQWQNLSFAVGRKNRSQWLGNPTTFDWTQIKKIRLVFDLNGTGSGDFLFDHMFFGGGRWEATREDSASQAQYGLREKVETDEELHSDSECDYRAKALLDFLKSPIETLKVRSEVIDYGTTPILAGDKIHVIIPNENIDSDYRIISAEYKASGRDQTLEVELELAKEPLLLADFIYGFRKSIAKLDKYKASASASGVSSGGGGGGGGGGEGGSMSQHANEWHDPDMEEYGKIKGKTVDDSAIGDDKILVYKTSGDKIVYEAKPSVLNGCIFKCLGGFDVYSMGGTVTKTSWGVKIFSSLSSPWKGYAFYDYAAGLASPLIFDKSPQFECYVNFNNSSSLSPQYYIIIGGTAGAATTASHKKFGVFIDTDGSLKIVSSNGTTQNTVDTGYDLAEDTWYRIRCKLTSGSQIEVWVDGTSKGTKNTNLPNGALNGNHACPQAIAQGDADGQITLYTMGMKVIHDY